MAIIIFMSYHGRPEDEQFTKVIAVRVSPKEHAEITKALKDEPKSLSALGREFFLGLLKQKGKR